MMKLEFHIFLLFFFWLGGFAFGILCFIRSEPFYPVLVRRCLVSSVSIIDLAIALLFSLLFSLCLGFFGFSHLFFILAFLKASFISYISLGHLAAFGQIGFGIRFLVMFSCLFSCPPLLFIWQNIGRRKTIPFAIILFISAILFLPIGYFNYYWIL